MVVTIKLCYTVGKAGDLHESEQPTHRTYSGMSVVLSLQCKDRADGGNDGKGFRRLFYCVVCQNTGCDWMSAQDKQRLQQHIHMAEQAGADITTLYGDDIPQQIAEFAGSPALQKSYWGAPAYIAATSGVGRR